MEICTNLMQRTNIIKSAIIKRAVRDCNGVVFWYVLLILSISENQTKHGQASTYSVDLFDISFRLYIGSTDVRLTCIRYISFFFLDTPYHLQRT